MIAIDFLFHEDGSHNQYSRVSVNLLFSRVRFWKVFLLVTIVIGDTLDSRTYEFPIRILKKSWGINYRSWAWSYDSQNFKSFETSNFLWVHRNVPKTWSLERIGQKYGLERLFLFFRISVRVKPSKTFLTLELLSEMESSQNHLYLKARGGLAQRNRIVSTGRSARVFSDTRKVSGLLTTNQSLERTNVSLTM